jgi:predicted ATPase
MKLTGIIIKNFKCFKDGTLVSLKGINLFTGTNGKGKSTALQTLLLMKQSIEHNISSKQIIFNGNCINIGSFQDVKNKNVSQIIPIKFVFCYKDSDSEYNLSYLLFKNENDEMVANIERIIVDGELNKRKFRYVLDKMKNGNYNLINSYNTKEKFKYPSLVNLYLPLVYDNYPFDIIGRYINFSKIHYVSADRIGPREFYPKASFSEFPTVGSKGEFTANILYKKKNDLVYDELCIDKVSTKTVLDQTSGWIKKIFDDVSIDINSGSETNSIINLLINKNRPVNEGFGISYVLPIIVSGLIAQKDEILIVENPEAHLHPSAQSELTKFLSIVSKCGVQVLIESHSEHILNALRVSVVDGLIKSDSVNIMYFQKDENKNVIDIKIDEYGKIENWPSGFFDQTEKDFEKLFGV